MTTLPTGMMHCWISSMVRIFLLNSTFPSTITRNLRHLPYLLKTFRHNGCLLLAADKCETNDKVYLLGKTCFEISTRLESWFEARNACLLKKGDLLYSINLQDIETLKGIAEENSASIAHFKFWIGLRKVSWIWKSNFIGTVLSILNGL